jgi:hypothetical protein
MVVFTDDGVRLEGRSRSIVALLRAASWGGPAPSKEQWMREVAQRARATTGQRVRANSEANFVNDLVKAGLLKKEEPNAQP